jgi:hypothetical protein
LERNEDGADGGCGGVFGTQTLGGEERRRYKNKEEEDVRRKKGRTNIRHIFKYGLELIRKSI